MDSDSIYGNYWEKSVPRLSTPYFKFQPSINFKVSPSLLIIFIKLSIFYFHHTSLRSPSSLSPPTLVSALVTHRDTPMFSYLLSPSIFHSNLPFPHILPFFTLSSLYFPSFIRDNHLLSFSTPIPYSIITSISHSLILYKSPLISLYFDHFYTPFSTLLSTLIFTPIVPSFTIEYISLILSHPLLLAYEGYFSDFYHFTPN